MKSMNIHAHLGRRLFSLTIKNHLLSPDQQHEYYKRYIGICQVLFFEIVKNNFSLFYFQSCPPPVWSGSVGFSPGFSGVDGLSPGFSSPESGFESLSPVSGLVGVEGFESSEEEEPVEDEPDEVLSVEVVVLPEEEPEVSVDAVPEG